MSSLRAFSALVLFASLLPAQQTSLKGTAALKGVAASKIGGNGFARAITVNHAQVPNTNQTNFPVLVAGTYGYLATIANGGKVRNANGYDVNFYTSSDCSTGKMDWEVERYTAATGQVVYWIRSATISHTVDTTFYLCYGNPSITTDQSNAAGVWDSHYLLVWHMNQDPSLGTILDSTSHGNHGIVNGSMTSAQSVASAIGLGIQFGGPFSQFLSFTSNPAFTNASFSMQAIANATDTANLSGILGNDSTIPGLYVWNDGHFAFYTNANVLENTTSISTNTNYWVAATLNHIGTNNNQKTILFNGAAENTATMNDTTHTLNKVGSLSSIYMRGTIDEIRVSDIVRSADWYASEYNNQKPSSTFLTIGSESSL